MTGQYTYDNKGKVIGVFIPIGEWKKIVKTHKDLAIEEEPAPTKNEILESISEGIQLTNLHKEGKMKLKSAQQLLDELG